MDDKKFLSYFSDQEMFEEMKRRGFSVTKLVDPNACIDCDKMATYIRHTQFAGDHPFCTEHAQAERDFMDNKDDSTVWEKLSSE